MDETPIEIVAHDPEWVERFEAERRRLRTWIGAYTARIEHVGSTAVPGLAAKPVVDVTAVVTDVDGLWGDLDKLAAALGYRLSHVPDRHLFLQRRDDDGQAYNLHLIRESNDLWRGDLRFREYLRATPDAREEYEAAKREAAAAHPGDIDAYNEAKGDVAGAILERAEADDSIDVPGGDD
jgi:GrpB-like predicted nucleotidyltransferase (UPF0157 family)